MAQITLTIPDAQVNRVIKALTADRLDPATGEPVAATAANAKAAVVDWIKDRVVSYEYQQAREAAINSVTLSDATGLVS